jgi:hypothetical protein
MVSPVRYMGAEGTQPRVSLGSAPGIWAAVDRGLSSERSLRRLVPVAQMSHIEEWKGIAVAWPSPFVNMCMHRHTNICTHIYLDTRKQSTALTYTQTPEMYIHRAPPTQ